MSLTKYGIDIAQPVFHLYWVDRDSGEVVSEHIARADFLAPGMEMITKPFAIDDLAQKVREILMTPQTIFLNGD